MKTELILFRLDAPALIAAPGSAPGEGPDGTVVCAVENCPDDLPADAVLELVRGLYPTEGVTAVDYAQLAAWKSAKREGGCCGGSCGGKG
jgi:hypothetical protein